MDRQSCTITGCTPQRFKFKYNEEAPLCKAIKTAIAEEIKRLYADGVKLFYAGCAVGVDTWAAEIVLSLKKQAGFSDIELFCTIAFPEQADRFTKGQKRRNQRILSQCSHKEVINRHYSPVAYKRINYYMINNSQHLIAVFDHDKSERNGLVQMINYAIKKNLQITFIHPDTAQRSNYTP